MNTGKPLRHRLSRRSVLVGAGAALMSRNALAQVSDEVVKVGVLTDMSGIFSDNSGIGMVTAAKMAVEDFGGSAVGKPIEVIFANHQNKPDIALGIARNWNDTEHVDVIVDAIGSSVASRFRWRKIARNVSYGEPASSSSLTSRIRGSA